MPLPSSLNSQPELIFGLGLVFLVGGISSIKGSNWLIRAIISFSR